MKKLSLLFILLVTVGTSQAQTKVGDATLPNTVTFSGENLTINGAGMREKFFFDIYAGGLYLKKKSASANAIAAADETMAIKLHILSGMMSRSKMVTALREGFKKSTNNNTAAIDKRIDTFIGFIKDEIEVGQIYDIVYEQGKGSVIYKDGVERGHVEGLDFKEALFNIWIGDKPADKGLKNEMLGAF
ncbi:chalcone isomerase family protein [Aquimarina sp. 2201CG14-23]|uniref:chalcone isomerase family protein n=1 Tax=Aquimarina mycalae TaxID=3040073 RepID=UPI0024782D3C|nr:chalcone isomerase family protein [Aquimarina sp. 2201CG14-23]MDH7446669.1 chalcone isomerase family protein [Aquimarina sp. 2201CG14-23]